MKTRLTCLLFIALAVPLFAADPPPQVYIPTPPPVLPPIPTVQTITCPLGDFVPLYVDKTLKARVKFSDPTVFCKPLKLASGVTHSGILFSDPKQIPQVFTMATDGYILTGMRSGTTVLTVDANGTDGPVDLYTVSITVGTPTPPPPDPGPGPGPGPPPSPAPIPVAGFRVLMVYESADLSKMPAAQQVILYSKPVRDYLNAKCIMGPDNKTHDWRIWDRDSDTSNESALWQAAMKRPRASVPWIIISDGKKGYEGPLPATVDETLALLKKYAEP